MTFDDLNRALAEALATGQIGTPVSLRVHFQVPDSAADLAAMVAAVMRLSQPVFRERPSTLAAREHPHGRQWNVLVGYPGGATAFVTAGCGSARQPSLRLLLVGNHGIVRLEGPDQFEDDLFSPHAGSDVEQWRSAVTASVARGGVVELRNSV